MKPEWFGISRFQTWLLTPAKITAAGEPILRILNRRPKSSPPANKDATAHRILVVRLDEIGDVQLCSAFMRELRKNYPSAHITWIVKPVVFNLVELCPYVNEIITFDWQTFPKRLRPLLQHAKALGLAATRLWNKRFDLAINCRRGQDIYSGNFLMYASGAPVRIGYWHPSNVSTNDAPHQRHNPVLTRVLETQSGLHEVLHNLHLLVQIGLSVRDTSLETWIDETDRRAAERFLDRSGQDPGDRLIVIAPGAATPEKVWPAENYKALIERLHLKTSWKFVIIGGPGEVATGEFLRQGNELWVTNLAGKTTLRQTIAVLELTSLLIGNDSGPSHLAAAAKTPVVQIQSFAKTGEADHVRSPVRFRPWGVASAIIQPAQPLPPCVQACEANHPHCITQVTIDEVELAALRLLQASQPSIQPD